MAVPSDGSYGIPEGLIFSFPVEIVNGQWKIVQGLELDEFAQSKIKTTTDELMAERGEALEACGETANI
jgi:malate/lactate dehydrogenase